MKLFKKTNNSQNYKIDMVYLWVDGSDQEFQKQRKFYQEKCGVKEGESCSEHNYVDHEELRYSLRSVFKNAPWINKIYIVTNGQIPKWLDLTKTDKIKIINHSQIMPKDALPTFHSTAIEVCVGNIPDLEEHFILANDDTFISRPVTPSFFFDKNGNPIFRFENKKTTIGQLKCSGYCRRIAYTNRLINKLYNKHFHVFPHHNIDAYRKSILLECINKFEDEFNKMIFSKFRRTGIQRLFFSLYSIVNYGYSSERVIEKIHLGIHRNSFSMRVNKIEKMIDEIKRYTPNLLCLNDHLNVEKCDLDKLKSFLEYLFPEKQVYETNEKIEGIYPDVIEKCKKLDKKYGLIWKILRIIEILAYPVFYVDEKRNHVIVKILSIIKINVKKSC